MSAQENKESYNKVILSFELVDQIFLKEWILVKFQDNSMNNKIMEIIINFFHMLQVYNNLDQRAERKLQDFKSNLMKMILLMSNNLLGKMSSLIREWWILDRNKDSKQKSKKLKNKRWRSWKINKTIRIFCQKLFNKLRQMQLDKLSNLLCISSINQKNQKMSIF